jgi:hypothetical protein
MSLSTKQALLDEYIAAEIAVLKNQSYTIKDRTYTRADLAAIQKGRKDLEDEIAQIQAGGMKVKRVLFRDD